MDGSKEQAYSGTDSLSNRVAIVIGIHILGYDVFFERLFRALDLRMGDMTLHYLRRQQLFRTQAQAHSRDADNKKKRRTKTYEKLKEYHSKLWSARAKGLQYKAGVGMRNPEKVAEREREKERTTISKQEATPRQTGGDV